MRGKKTHEKSHDWRKKVENMKTLVTGGAGFIGSNLIHNESFEWSCFIYSIP
jgi:FlaA1/EpsC-like NDP-sugar epimerase